MGLLFLWPSSQKNYHSYVERVLMTLLRVLHLRIHVLRVHRKRQYVYSIRMFDINVAGNTAVLHVQ